MVQRYNFTRFNRWCFLGIALLTPGCFFNVQPTLQLSEVSKEGPALSAPSLLYDESSELLGNVGVWMRIAPATL